MSPHRFYQRGVMVFFLMMLLGLLRGYYHQAPNQSQFFGNVETDEIFWMVSVNEPPKRNKGNLKFEVELLAGMNQDQCLPVNGKASVTLKADLALNYGDQLIIRNKFQEIKEPANPGEFDYKNYQANQNVFHQAYLKKGDFVYYKSESSFLGSIYNFREKLSNILHSKIEREKSAAVASALILGQKDFLDKETKTLFAQTGSMHVLAVSGLHVGVILYILNFLFNFLNRGKIRKIIKMLITVSLLWAFALMTGLAPSVFRAALMFTMVAVGMCLSRTVNIYNTLSGSALILLLYDPSLIFQVGFQLSYLALLGIVYIQPKLEALWECENKVLSWVWSLTSVSIAAQISTFPLGLYYFKQFPVYFFLSNVFVICLAYALLVFGILLFVFSFSEMLSDAIGGLLNALVYWNNQLLGLIQHLPGSTFNTMAIETIEMLLLYGGILSLILLFKFRGLKYFYSMMLLSLVFTSLQFSESYRFNYEQQLIVYHFREQSAIELYEGRSVCFYGDEELLEPGTYNGDLIQRYRKKRAIENVCERGVIGIQKGQQDGMLKAEMPSVFKFGESIVLILNPENFHLLAGRQIKVDKVILTQKIKVLPEVLFESIQCKEIILDGSVSRKLVEQYKSYCQSMKIEFYSTYESGAYVVSF